MIVFACVYNGDRYNVDWVHRLRAGLMRNYSGHAQFKCLSREPIADIDTVPLIHDWPGFWSKIELFRPGIFPHYPVCYLDLDVMVLSDITKLMENKIENNMKALWLYREPKRRVPNSSLMYWMIDKPGLYERFRDDVDGQMAKYGGDQYPHFNHYGDQAFIADRCGPMKTWNNHYPEEWFHVFSEDNQRNFTAPSPEAKLSICLGEPKFDNFPDEEWVNENWKSDVRSKAA